MEIILLVNRLTHKGALTWRRVPDKPFTLCMPHYEAVMMAEGGDHRIIVIGDDKLGIFYSHGNPDEIITFNRASVLNDLYRSVRASVGDLQESELFMDRALSLPFEELLRKQPAVAGSSGKNTEE
jgi:hypothetical protein